jgi:PadR family transcriptional regulator, regulatory protein PadR
MAAKRGDILQGTLEMLVLKTLALQPMHGFGISARIAQMSGGLFHVIPGSLFPALNRLEREGRIKGEWRSTENNRRARYYALTELGRKALKEEIKTWDRQVGAVARILEA